jgi:hypothetical protein
MKKMGVNQASIHNHLLKMATLPNLINADLRVTSRLSRGFTVAQVAQKHGWTDPNLKMHGISPVILGVSPWFI